MIDEELIYVEPCTLRPGQEPGWVYFIACSETRRLKIGYTKSDPLKRMKNLQTGASGELVFIAKHPGTPETERALHQRFSAQRLHGEWFEMDEEMFTYLCLTTWIMAAICVREGISTEEWIVTGLRTIRDHWKDQLPPELEALIK